MSLWVLPTQLLNASRDGDSTTTSLRPWASIYYSISTKLWPVPFKATKHLFSPLSLWSSLLHPESSLHSQEWGRGFWSKFRLMTVVWLMWNISTCHQSHHLGSCFNTLFLCLIRSLSELMLSVKNQNGAKFLQQWLKNQKPSGDPIKDQSVTNTNAWTNRNAF